MLNWNQVKTLVLFYKRMLIPTFFFTALIGLSSYSITGAYSLVQFGIAFMFVLPLMHYFLNEVLDHTAYYFYFTQGLSKLYLRTATGIISIVTMIISACL
ncbi:MAG: hypothetical protein MUC81_13455 [Bacteroidia bacterium]|nr:hypothetical protein [Bacteroidia bacterium]